MGKCFICKGPAYAPMTFRGHYVFHDSCLAGVIGLELHPRWPNCDFPNCGALVATRCAHGWYCERHNVGCPDDG